MFKLNLWQQGTSQAQAFKTCKKKKKILDTSVTVIIVHINMDRVDAHQKRSHGKEKGPRLDKKNFDIFGKYDTKNILR